MGDKALTAAQTPIDQNAAALTAPLAGDIAGAAKAATVPSFGDRAFANLKGNLYAQGLLDPNSPASMSFMGQPGYGWYGQQPYDPLQFLRPIR